MSDWNGLHRQRNHRRDEVDVKTCDYWHLADAIIELNKRIDLFEESYKVAKGADNVLRGFKAITEELTSKVKNLTPPASLEKRLDSLEAELAEYKRQVGITPLKDAVADLVIQNKDIQDEIQRIDNRWVTDVKSFENNTNLRIRQLQAALEAKIKGVKYTVTQLRELLEKQEDDDAVSEA